MPSSGPKAALIAAAFAIAGATALHAQLPIGDTALTPPDWLAPYVVREVTGEPAYVNAVLAR